MTVTVWAETHLPGFHCWPAAPPHRAYLADRHRHMFHIRATVPVGHDDRDVEFHDLQHLIAGWWGPGERECGPASCETLARQLATHLEQAGIAVASVDVSEDGQAGATYTTRTPGCTP